MSIPVPLEELRFASRGPPVGFHYDECYACFAEQGGLLFRLVTYQTVTDAPPRVSEDGAATTAAQGRVRPVWAFYNDTTSTIMKVRCTFKVGSQVQTLGHTEMVPCTEEEQAQGNHDDLPLAAALDVYPGETELYVAVRDLAGFHLSYVTAAAPASSVEFLNAMPTVRYDKVYKCFKNNGNGLLFRLVDEENGVWAFYNDTREYIMKVEMILEDVSHTNVKPLGHTVVSACPDHGDDTALFTLFVEPCATLPLLQGTPKLYRLSFSAEPVPMSGSPFAKSASPTPLNVDARSDDSRLSLSMQSARLPAALPLHPNAPVPTPQEQQQQQQQQEHQQQHIEAQAPLGAHELTIAEQASFQAASASSVGGISVDGGRGFSPYPSPSQPARSELGGGGTVYGHTQHADPNKVDPGQAREEAGHTRGSMPTEQPSAPDVAAPVSSTFLNGAPNPEIIPLYHRVFPCFEGHGNGLLFRLVDDVNHIWAFYNDTREYVMEIHIRLHASADLLMAPGVRVVDDPTSSDGRRIASVLVPPLATAPFLVGEPADFELAASALPYVPEESAKPATYAAAPSQEELLGQHQQQQQQQPQQQQVSAIPLMQPATPPMSTPNTIVGGRYGNGYDGRSSTLTRDDDDGTWLAREDVGTYTNNSTHPPVVHPDQQNSNDNSSNANNGNGNVNQNHLDSATPYASVSEPLPHTTIDPLTPLDDDAAERVSHDGIAWSAQQAPTEFEDDAGSVPRTPMISISYGGSPLPPPSERSAAEVMPSSSHLAEPANTEHAQGSLVENNAAAFHSGGESVAAPPPFEHGEPNVQVMERWDRYYKCFKEHGNGLLFRLVDVRDAIWGFYNDTPDHCMHVHVLFEPDEDERDVVPLGDAHTLVDPDLGRVLALDVPPLATRLFCQYPSDVFTTKFMAVPADPSGVAYAYNEPLPQSHNHHSNKNNTSSNFAQSVVTATTVPSISPLSPPLERDGNAESTGPDMSEGGTVNIDAPSMTPRSEEGHFGFLSDLQAPETASVEAEDGGVSS